MASNSPLTQPLSQQEVLGLCYQFNPQFPEKVYKDIIEVFQTNQYTFWEHTNVIDKNCCMIVFRVDMHYPFKQADLISLYIYLDHQYPNIYPCIKPSLKGGVYINDYTCSYQRKDISCIFDQFFLYWNPSCTLLQALEHCKQLFIQHFPILLNPMRTNQDSRNSRYSILSDESSTSSQSNASQPVNNESIPQETRGSNRKIGVTYCIQYQETIRYQSNNSQESIDRNISCFENVLTRQEFDLRNVPVIQNSLLKMGNCLGSGSFAKTYAAKYGNQDVVIKIPKHLPTEDERVSLNREIYIMSCMKYPYCIQLYGITNMNGLPVLVMEKADKCLTALLEAVQEVIPLSVCYIWAIQIASALYYLHQCNFIHRDLKARDSNTDNILLVRGNCKLADFGLSRSVARNNLMMTMNKGTPLTMAPELISNEMNAEYTNKVDVYSYGFILYSIFTRIIPFQNYPGTADTYKRDVLRGLRPEIPSSVPSDISDIIKCCWRADPNTRPDFKQIIDRLMPKVRSMSP